MHDVPDADSYDNQIVDWYTIALNSNNKSVQKSSASSLCSFYIRKKQYDKAEQYLSYLGDEDSEKKRLQAIVFTKTKKTNEAYRIYEELMLSEITILKQALNDLKILYMADGNLDMARKLTNIECYIARLFEMGAYQENSPALDLAVYEKDVEETARVMKAIIDNVETIAAFSESQLFVHLKKKTAEPALYSQVKANLINCFKDEDEFGYMKGNAFWDSLKKK